MTRRFRQSLPHVLIWMVITLTAVTRPAQGVDYFWNVANGDYTTAANWNPPTGPPTTLDNAYINNGGTATLASGLGDSSTFEIGSVAGSSGHIIVSGGDLFAAEKARIGEVGTGTATISSGVFQVGIGKSMFVGGENSTGTGTMTVSGASTAVISRDDLIMGRVGTGTLNFQGGWMTGVFTVVGKFGTGTWNQSGGVFEQDGGDVEIGDGGRPDEAGTAGPRFGTINLTGGVLQGAGHLAIGNRVGGGEVNISGGALALTADVGDGSIIIGRGMNWESMPGAGGATTLRVIGDDSTIIANGSLQMNPVDVHSSSTLIAKITGPTHTPIKVAGNATIGNGEFKVELEGYTPVLGNSWTIIQAGADITAEKTAISALANSLTTATQYNGLEHVNPGAIGTLMGTFESEDFSQAPLSAGLVWDVDYVGNSVLLKVIAAPGRPGDYNANGTVDAADYVAWRDKFGQMVTLPNDITPGMVDQSDYGVWRANFGLTGGTGAGLLSAGQAVPELGAGLLFIVGLAVMTAAKRGELRN